MRTLPLGIVIPLLSFSGSGRCTSEEGFLFYRNLDLCYKIHDPHATDFNFFKSTCASANAELIKVDTEEKQRYGELISGMFSI